MHRFSDRKRNARTVGLFSILVCLALLSPIATLAAAGGDACAGGADAPNSEDAVPLFNPLNLNAITVCRGHLDAQDTDDWYREFRTANGGIGLQIQVCGKEGTLVPRLEVRVQNAPSIVFGAPSRLFGIWEAENDRCATGGFSSDDPLEAVNRLSIHVQRVTGEGAYELRIDPII